MKIEDKTLIPNDVVARDIPEGTVFKCTYPDHGVFLRIYQYIVDLNDPRRTFTLDVKVNNYKPVKATITIEDL